MQAPQFAAMIAAIDAQPTIGSGQWFTPSGPCTVTALALGTMSPEKRRYLGGLIHPEALCRMVAAYYHVPRTAVNRLVEFTDKYAPTTPGQTVREAVLLLLYDLQYGWRARYGDNAELHSDSLYDVYGVESWLLGAIEEHKRTHYAKVHEAVLAQKNQGLFGQSMFLEILTDEQMEKSVKQMQDKMKGLSEGLPKKSATVAEFGFFSIDSMALSECVKPIEDFEELYTTKPAQKDIYANFVSMYGSMLAPKYTPTKTIKMVKSKEKNPCAEIPLKIDWSYKFDPKIAEAAETVLSLTPATAPPNQAEIDAAINDLIDSTAMVTI